MLTVEHHHRKHFTLMLVELKAQKIHSCMLVTKGIAAHKAFGDDTCCGF
ncbi:MULTISPECIES: hypothetical protein [Shewanella]|nr:MULTISPECIES: hypothetical protein [unclassified Shewanella]NSM24250.1 hypothetical protein [Shewanella sp. ZOR0012]